jgi:hypothetical protein
LQQSSEENRSLEALRMLRPQIIKRELTMSRHRRLLSPPGSKSLSARRQETARSSEVAVRFLRACAGREHGSGFGVASSSSIGEFWLEPGRRSTAPSSDLGALLSNPLDLDDTKHHHDHHHRQHDGARAVCAAVCACAEPKQHQPDWRKPVPPVAPANPPTAVYPHTRTPG